MKRRDHGPMQGDKQPVEVRLPGFEYDARNGVVEEFVGHRSGRSRQGHDAAGANV